MLAMLATPHWTTQTSGVTARLRGVSAVSERVAWASGSGSTVLRTMDGGQSWQKLHVTDDAQAVEQLGHPIALLENTTPNPKLTTPADLPYLEFLLSKPEA